MLKVDMVLIKGGILRFSMESFKDLKQAMANTQVQCLDLWFNSDEDYKPLDTFKITKITTNNKSNKVEYVELTEMRGSNEKK